MACEKRQRTGSCMHFQCPFSELTTHGYECVEVVDGYCEVGDGCYPGCNFSWDEDDDEKTEAACKAFDVTFGESDDE